MVDKVGWIRLDTQGLFGFVVVVLGLWLLTSRIVVTPSCDFSDVTYSRCGTGNFSEVKNDNIVRIMPCDNAVNPNSRSYGQQDFKTNVELSDTCQRYGCKGCFKTSQSCNNVTAPPSKICVPAHSAADIPPIALFVYLFLYIPSGLVFMLFSKDLANNAGKVVAFSVFLLGWHYLESTIQINNACPWGDQTYSQCGTGVDGEVSNTQIVSFTMCSTSDSPFFTPAMKQTQDNCLRYGCSGRQCLRTVTPCPTGTGTTTYQCVATQSTASIGPADLFVSILIIFAGALMFFWVGRTQGSGDHHSQPRGSVEKHEVKPHETETELTTRGSVKVDG